MSRDPESRDPESRESEGRESESLEAEGRESDREKARAVRRMFAAIAPRYDFLNRLLSLSLDRGWRRAGVDQLMRSARPAGIYLDCCAGTGDLALEMARRPTFRGRVLAVDFALPMLRRGRAKLAGLPASCAAADALSLPLRDASLSGAIIGFGLRNLANLDAGLTELARVLAPGAPVVVLEFSVPDSPPLRALYLLYFRGILPLVGRLVSGHGNAYSYLPSSVLQFPAPADLARRVSAAGFRDVAWSPLSRGIVTLHAGIRA